MVNLEDRESGELSSDWWNGQGSCLLQNPKNKLGSSGNKYLLIYILNFLISLILSIIKFRHFQRGVTGLKLGGKVLKRHETLISWKCMAVDGSNLGGCRAQSCLSCHVQSDCLVCSSLDK